MNKKISLSALCYILAVLVSSHTLASETAPVGKQDSEPVSIVKQPEKKLWETSLESSWFNGSTIHGTGGELSMTELKAAFTRRFLPNPLVGISAGIQYSLKEFEAPQTARLPESLQRLSIIMGGEYHSSDDLTYGFRLSPGISSDNIHFDASDIRVPVALHATYKMSRKLSLTGGVAYTGHKHSAPLLPLIGIRYLPTEQWFLALGLPRTAVVYKPNRETDIFVAGEFSGGEYRLHDPSIGADIVSYRDYRLLAGAETGLSPYVRVGIAGGYAFAREFDFYEGNRRDVQLDNALFGRLTIKLFW